MRRFNLILFGDPGSNQLISLALREMPVQWTRHEIQLGSSHYPAAEHGLQMISPSPLPGALDRYVVFNSGHTYHDSELRFSYMVFPRLGDWAITKVGKNPRDSAASKVDETVLQSGFFDEEWKIPSAFK